MKKKSEYRPAEWIQIAILKALENYLGAGNRISKKNLIIAVNLLLFTLVPMHERPYKVSDRSLRLAIEWLRRYHPEGAKICSSLAGGYFIARSANELEEYLTPDNNRALNILARNSAQKKMAHFIEGGQQKLFE